MKIHQFYTACLAQASYYIESEGIAAVIDPLRDIEAYLEMARADKAVIRYVLVTHFHADFVSGHLELADRTGAEIILGPGATPGYPVRIAADRELLPLGNCSLRVLHTPGHTIESVCFLLSGENNRPYALFTGDTLFVGDTGRPDLLSGNLDARDLASRLYLSVHRQIAPLPDEVLIYPGHGAGSACGKNLGPETWSTIGEQRTTNPVFVQRKEAFVAGIVTDQPPIPAYFFKDAAINKKGCEHLDTVLAHSLRPLSAEDFRQEMASGATVLDTRALSFPEHRMIQNALHIGLDGQFAVWAGALIPFDKPLLLVSDPGTEKETVTRLARIGFDQCSGYLSGGMQSWDSEQYASSLLTTVRYEELEEGTIYARAFRLLDVRNTAEFNAGHLPGAIHIPLNGLREKAQLLNKDQCYAIYCAGGYRSAIAVSILQQEGFHYVCSIAGGYAAAGETYSRMAKTM